MAVSCLGKADLTKNKMDSVLVLKSPNQQPSGLKTL